MSRKSSGTRAKLNVPLIALWLASVVVALVGYLMMTSSNSTQAALYTSGAADYAKLFTAQSGSTVGGLLIAVGAFGVLLALAAQAAARGRATEPERVVLEDTEPVYDESLSNDALVNETHDEAARL